MGSYTLGVDLSPFPHQGPLTPEQVRGRVPLVADLVERATARRITALLGPRRFGKTSVLRKVRAVLADAGTAVIWIDLYETRSAADLVVRVDHALASTGGSVRDRLDSLAASASVNLGMFKLEFARPVSQRPDADASLHVVLDLLVDAALAAPTVIVVDEFTGLTGVSGATGLLRTKLQHHVQDIGLLFAGSEPTAMAAMFADGSQPFYGQADVVEIQPFSIAELRTIVVDGFAATDRDAGDLPAQLARFTGGHPYRAMQLADAAWRLAVPGKDAPVDLWPRALAEVEAMTGAGLEMLFSSFSSSEQAVLRSLAGNRPLFGGSLELFGSSSGAVAAARDRLVGGGVLTSEPAIVDPLIAHWIRRRFDL